MENFVVSARKYRPATFENVIGQQHITNTLKNAIKNNQLAQAFLFCGPRGVGKTTCARILAKTINCLNIKENTEACNTCDSCVSFNKGGSLNIHELDAASNNSVEDIRSLVDQVRYPPQIGKYKIYIIDEVHMLSNSAFNAFLKTLEEPPPYAIFILATTEKHKIIPTILSRCQIFDFNRIMVDDMTTHLANIAVKENIATETEGLHIIAQKADGALRDALSMFDQIASFSGNNITYKAVIDNLNILDYDYYFKVTDALLAENMAATLLLFDEVLSNGFDGNNFVNGLSGHFRDLLVSKDERTIKLLQVTDRIAKSYASQSVSASASFLLTALTISNQCDLNYKQSKNQRLLVELALLKMCHINAVVKISAENGNSEEKKNAKRLNTNAVDGEKIAESKPQVIDSKETAEKINNSSNFSEADKLIAKDPNLANSVEGETIENENAIPVENSVKPVAYTSTRKNAEIPSLKSVFEIKTIAEIVSEDQPAITMLNQASSIFSEKSLKDLWKNYAEKMLAEKKMSLHSALTHSEPQINDVMVKIEVANSIQRDAIDEHRQDLLGFLRKELNNYEISLEIVLSKEDESIKMPYTNSDKYAYLATKYPALNEIKKKFDLEIEH